MTRRQLFTFDYTPTMADDEDDVEHYARCRPPRHHRRPPEQAQHHNIHPHPCGGVVFGPKPKDWSIKINRKEKWLAISTAVASVAENTIVVQDFNKKFEKVEKPKMTEFIATMKR
ncbi:hypothetical protein ACFX1X_019563 [Malus domestica]